MHRMRARPTSGLALASRLALRGLGLGLGLAFGLGFGLDACANVVGSDAQNFNPTTSGLDFVTVQSSETLEPGVFNLGFFANYAKNAFPYYARASSTASATRTEKNNALTGGDLNVGLGLAKNWDAGASLPFILSQEVSDSGNVGYYSSTGNTEIRVNSKYRLVGSQSRGVALVASANFNRIANNPYVGEGGGPIYNLEIAADTTVAQAAIGLNLGRRWRNPGRAIASSGIEPIPDQWIGSMAGSYRFDSIDTKLILEILAAVPDQQRLVNATDREYSVAEALLGAKYDANSNFAIHVGGGASLAKGVSSPDYRIYAGLNLSFGAAQKPRGRRTDPYVEELRRARIERARLRAQVAALQARLAKDAGKNGASPEDAAQAAANEPPPAVRVESVRQIPVIDRGSYNHVVIENLSFLGATTRLKPESEAYLANELTPALRELNARRPIASIVVEGHADAVGSEPANLRLSELRARIAADFLRRNLGVDVPIEAVGRGSSSPIADNGNFQGRELNRRVEFKILYRRSPR